jgi:hypothetical protein
MHPFVNSLRTSHCADWRTDNASLPGLEQGITSAILTDVLTDQRAAISVGRQRCMARQRGIRRHRAN